MFAWVTLAFAAPGVHVGSGSSPTMRQLEFGNVDSGEPGVAAKLPGSVTRLAVGPRILEPIRDEIRAIRASVRTAVRILVVGLVLLT